MASQASMLASVFPFSARPPSLIIPRLSLICHHYHRSCSKNSYIHPNPLFYRSHHLHRVRSYSDCSKVNLAPIRSTYWDQGVHGGSQSRFSNCQPRVRTEREQQRGCNPYPGFLGMEAKKIYGSCDAESQAPNISTSSSASERFMSPYGGYNMNDSSLFAHTTRLNIIGPNPNYTRFLRRRSSSTERLLFNCRERSMSTAAFSFPKIDRSRSPSPPVPSPTESYLQLSLQPSLPLADPTASRKLLVLDLSGTLLRSSYNGEATSRNVYPRPYLPSFLAYIFHPTTLQWLDTMVWSSAQPRDILTDMVDKCFGTYKEGLKAVWAKENCNDLTMFFGHTVGEKTQMIKDLARSWARIPSHISNLSDTQSPENPNTEVDADRENYPLVSQQQHSALTTILLDNFSLNAVLQPWNRLCVSDYGRKKRGSDDQIAWLERRKLNVRITELELELAELEPAKRMGKKLIRDGLLLAKRQQLEVQGKEEIRKAKERSFDESLLAVIGILEALKHEGNVAGWMRSGGLVHVVGEDSSIPTPIQLPPLWYKKPCVLSHWAQLGRKALAELEIDIIHGVVPVQEERTSHTEPYMQLSQQPSLSLANPAALRKLLVLDLEGILFRSAHSGFLDLPRIVCARPYLPSFLAYIFHPTTLQWLDSMVWSLAPSAVVNDRVDKTFGTYKEGLKAVWSEDRYKTTETTKNLASTWKWISTHPNSDADNHPSVPQQRHSALTTILLDNSPLNAVLQPWNHLCVSVYGCKRHKLDVQIAEQERLPLAKRQQLEVQGKEEIGRVEKEERYDKSLLAVIGILDALKHEGNVAGWMRSGGLVRVVGEAASSTPTSGDKDSVSIPTQIQSPLLWYEIPGVLSHWVQLGRKALAKLEVDIIHGVVPEKKEKRTSPTESYMQLSLQPSLSLADPTASRKLLVLDLDGILLSAFAFDGDRIRRPYLPCFLAYVFHPTTLQWLDTMVWGSLHLALVKVRVNICFGGYKTALKAIWAKEKLDTLAISNENYTKIHVTKDLARPWAQIPSTHPKSEDDADGDNHSSVPQQQHSALTTILVDNFPVNSILQPWNHLRVSVYEKDRYKLDVEIAEREQVRTLLAEMLMLEKETGRVESYDEMLLALIGVLDALKHEGNVAGWMRSGGLVHVVGDQETISETPETETPMTIPMPVSDSKMAKMTAVPSSTAEAASSTPTSGDKEMPTPISPRLWYETPGVLSHWAKHGRKALAELGIDVIHGVVWNRNEESSKK